MKIAILTSGGDAPGMNACIRAAVRSALLSGVEVVGFHRGYQGLIEDDFEELDHRSVSNIIQSGGTFLQTDRCKHFGEKEYRLKAAEILRRHGAGGLIVIGGDGSFRGARDLSEDTGFPVVGIPGTIDNDLAYTDMTLGFDTAVNNVLWAINALRDTMQSHNKVTFVEVMGRGCGDIALHAGITGGAEYVLIPEVPFDMEKISTEIKESAARGKKSNLVLVAEGAGNMDDLCDYFEKTTGMQARRTRLGFIQRGGSPTHIDRLLAARFGILAVKLLLEGKGGRLIGVRDGKVQDFDMESALAEPKRFDRELYHEAMSLV